MFDIAWEGFAGGDWQKSTNVSNFIVQNLTSYSGDEKFLAEHTLRTKNLWNKCKELLSDEYLKGGLLSIDTETVSGILNHDAGYIDRELEVIVGLQTDKPLKRAVNPFGGIRMAKQSCKQYNYDLSNKIEEIFTLYRKTHNEGVFSAYTPEMKKARKSGVVTGLPDAYGRGRIIGDYRRVPIYGVNWLVKEKQNDFSKTASLSSLEETIRLREEITEQIKALNALKEMALMYGYDISHPAINAHEAFQWLYFAYLAAIKEQNGAAMSLGRISTFLDIYIERDLQLGLISESQAQELVDQLVIKLRMVRHLRTREYNELFAGDPMWITESIGGISNDGIPMVTKTSFRFLNTLFNLGPSPEPNLTILWSEKLPEKFKKYCAKVSMLTSAIQYENDDLMRPIFGDDYGISCCVSPMKLGKEMQFFGARCNFPKLLLLALNGGTDEVTGERIIEDINPFSGEHLEYNEVKNIFKKAMEWISCLYVNTMNVIHYMHDKYAYEALEMSLHDTNVERNMAFGIAGLSVAVDSLSAIKYAKVKVIRNSDGLISNFEIEGDYPKFGNNDDKADSIAVDLTRDFYSELKKHDTYRNSIHTVSVLTITSNVVYGKKTGSTPDGRKAGEPFAPGANPMHGRDSKGALAMLSSVAKLPYDCLRDGISLTVTLVPSSLGKEPDTRIANLVALLDGYFHQSGHHININVFERCILENAMQDPSNYPQLTIRVSGYAVNFVKLTQEQQLEVISRTFHKLL